MVGPASYNHHESYKHINPEPCSAILHHDEYGKGADGNIIYVG